MKKFLIISLLLTSIPSHAKLQRISIGVNHCESVYPAHFVVNWANNTITLTLHGSDIYKVISVIDDKKSHGKIYTARKYFFGGAAYTQIELSSTSSGDFYRAWNNHANKYYPGYAKLSCHDD